MKFKIVLYLFLFACIVLFYQIFNTNKILNHQDELIQNQYQTQLQLKDSLAKLKRFQDTFAYFSLVGNSNLKEEITNASLLEKQVREQLLTMNTGKGLKALLKLSSGRFLIDKVKVVNQEWVLIGFKSDKNWGQALLEYKQKASGDFDFNVIRFFEKSL
jgi:hypothetical protein